MSKQTRTSRAPVGRLQFNQGGPLKPKREREFRFRGVRFFTRNLGAMSPMTRRWVWFAAGGWTYEGAHGEYSGVFSSLSAAVAHRFGLWDVACLPSLAKPRERAALLKFESELRAAAAREKLESA